MHTRHFLALELPDDIRDALGSLSIGVPGAYPEDEATLHLTVRFLGPIDGGKVQELCERLRRLDLVSFPLVLNGFGFFPPRGEAESLWIGVERSEPLEALRTKVDGLATRLGCEADRRRYIPHVTVARLSDAPESRLMSFIAGNSLWKSRVFDADRLTLFSSHGRDWGREYLREEVFLLKKAKDLR